MGDVVSMAGDMPVMTVVCGCGSVSPPHIQWVGGKWRGGGVWLVWCLHVCVLVPLSLPLPSPPLPSPLLPSSPLSLPSPLLLLSVQLGPDGGKYLSGVILNNKVLEHLVMNNCGLKDEGAIPIADGELGMRMCAVHV